MNRRPRTVYLDYNATTPLDPRAAEAIQLAWQTPGNASSRVTASGRQAQETLRRAAEDVAVLIGAASEELLWTSGATEANNIAIRCTGACTSSQVLASEIEHASVLESVRALCGEGDERASGGSEMAMLSVQGDGLLSVRDVVACVHAGVHLVSIMLVNNEIGVIQPISELSRELKHRFPNLLIHCDASQAPATLPIDVDELGVDLLSLSAHKMYGPQGIGALWVRAGTEVHSLLAGGGQQQGLRPGTVPVPLAAGFGAAARISMRERGSDASRIHTLRDSLLAKLRSEVGGVHLNGSNTSRAPGNLNIYVEGVLSEDLLEEVPDVEFSIGSACHGDDRTPSHVLQALGRPERLYSSIRLGIGRTTTRDEIDHAAKSLGRGIGALRALTRACA